MPTSGVERWMLVRVVYQDQIVVVLPGLHLFSASVHMVVSPALRVAVEVTNNKVISVFWIYSVQG